MRIYQGGPIFLPNPEALLAGLISEPARWVAIGAHTASHVSEEGAEEEELHHVDALFSVDGGYRSIGFAIAPGSLEPLEIHWYLAPTAEILNKVKLRDKRNASDPANPKRRRARMGRWAAAAEALRDS